MKVYILLFQGGPASNDSDFDTAVHAYLKESQVRNRLIRIIKQMYGDLPSEVALLIKNKDTKGLVSWYNDNLEPASYKIVNM